MDQSVTSRKRVYSIQLKTDVTVSVIHTNCSVKLQLRVKAKFALITELQNPNGLGKLLCKLERCFLPCSKFKTLLKTFMCRIHQKEKGHQEFREGYDENVPTTLTY